MAESSDPPPPGLTEEMQRVVDEAVSLLKKEHAQWAFNIGYQQMELMAGCWEAGVRHAYTIAPTRPNLEQALKDNPYRPKGDHKA